MTQKKILYVAAAGTLLMLLFPPFEDATGFAFILDPPAGYSLNLMQLVVQWLGLWVACGLLILISHQKK